MDTATDGWTVMQNHCEQRRNSMERKTQSLRIGVIVIAAYSIAFGTHLVAQERTDIRDRLGPSPRDQQTSNQERTSELPLVQKDAYSFARTGERTLSVDARIVGGVPAPIGAYPWQVSIGLVNVPPSVGHFCGGSIIGSNWIVTAAHCVDGNTKASSIQVVYGTNFLSQGGKVAQVSAIKIHDKWNKATYDYDVAVLRTVQTIEQPAIILLDQAQAPTLFPIGVLSTVSGWGLTQEKGNISDVLQHVGVQVTSNEICNSPTAYAGSITDRMACAGFATGGKDSCQGDSGGPMVVFDRKGGFVLAGIVSWGEGCARPNKFGVYTRASEVNGWVTGAIKD
jgi:transmembrane serine protease 9